jgi:hypothetical protein
LKLINYHSPEPGALVTKPWNSVGVASSGNLNVCAETARSPTSIAAAKRHLPSGQKFREKAMLTVGRLFVEEHVVGSFGQDQKKGGGSETRFSTVPQSMKKLRPRRRVSLI